MDRKKKEMKKQKRSKKRTDGKKPILVALAEFQLLRQPCITAPSLYMSTRQERISFLFQN
jgi:hypothetical protein